MVCFHHFILKTNGLQSKNGQTIVPIMDSKGRHVVIEFCYVMMKPVDCFHQQGPGNDHLTIHWLMLPSWTWKSDKDWCYHETKLTGRGHQLTSATLPSNLISTFQLQCTMLRHLWKIDRYTIKLRNAQISLDLQLKNISDDSHMLIYN